MPALCAERREPPTAMTCQPGRVRLRITWPPTISTSHTTRLNGTPATVASPSQSQTAEFELPIEIGTASCSSSTSTTARTMISVTSVVRNARSRR